jgi:Flp pilus assembly protein TadG
MQRSQRRKYRLLQRTEGAAAVELAIVLPVLLLLVCGIMDFGIIFFQLHNVNEAAREGARQTAVSQNLQTAASTTIAYIKSKYNNNYNVTVVPSPPVSGQDVTVTVTDSVNIITPIISVFFPSNPYTVKGKTVMRVE